jgi:hypothetical protein
MSPSGPVIAGVPVVFLLFAATLAGVLIAHGRAWAVGLAGLTVIAFVRVVFSPFDAAAHVAHEWPKLANLFGLLVGFAVLADHFDSSRAGSRATCTSATWSRSWRRRTRAARAASSATRRRR